MRSLYVFPIVDCGFAKISIGFPLSTIFPLFMRRMRSATFNAKDNSCVTTSIVLALYFASSSMITKTSRTKIGSSEAVGSSHKINSGSKANAHLIALSVYNSYIFPAPLFLELQQHVFLPHHKKPAPLLILASHFPVQ